MPNANCTQPVRGILDYIYYMLNIREKKGAVAKGLTKHKTLTKHVKYIKRQQRHGYLHNAGCIYIASRQGLD